MSCQVIEKNEKISLLDTLTQLYKKTIRKYQENAAIGELMQKEDHMLRDIGITKGDILWALQCKKCATKKLNAQARANQNPSLLMK